MHSYFDWLTSTYSRYNHKGICVSIHRTSSAFMDCIDLQKVRKWRRASWKNWNENAPMDAWCHTEGQEKKWWHSPCCWSLLHYREDAWVKTEMVRTCPAMRRWPLHQAYPRSWSVWTSESGKAARKRWINTILQYPISLNLTPVDVEDWDDWRRRTRVGDRPPEGYTAWSIEREREIDLQKVWRRQFSVTYSRKVTENTLAFTRHTETTAHQI